MEDWNQHTREIRPCPLQSRFLRRVTRKQYRNLFFIEEGSQVGVYKHHAFYLFIFRCNQRAHESAIRVGY